MPRFGELEAAIMDVVWRADGRLRVREVVDALQAERNAAFTTVQTVMNILHHKGWLDREKQGRAYDYWAAQPREDYTALLLGEALDTTDDRGAAISRILDQLDPSEVSDLQGALDDTRARREAG